MDPEYVSLSEARRLTGLGESTILRLGDTEQITTYRTGGNHRRFKKSDLFNLRGGIGQKSGEPLPTFIIYARVSSRKQVNDLDRQISKLKGQFPDYEIIKDVGSGLNFERPGLRKICDRLLAGFEIHLAIAHKDRLTRFGYELFEYLIQKNGGKIICQDSVVEKSRDQELAEDLLSIIQVFNSRANGKRRYKNEKGQFATPEASDEKGESETE